jgi:hypothetical protein
MGLAFDASAMVVGNGDTLGEITTVPEPAAQSLLGLPGAA